MRWISRGHPNGGTDRAVQPLAGNGNQWNNHYAAIHISPKGTAYLSGFPGGMWSLSDGR